MKHAIQTSVSDAVSQLISLQTFDEAAAAVDIHVERTKDPSHGDFACNIAMQLARVLKKNPREIATQLVDELAKSKLFDRVEIAGPGFINFHLSNNRYGDLVAAVLNEKTAFGTVQITADATKMLLEFVSANPTGPLHVGHGRGAAYGATLANLLRAAGHNVDCEYYVNDAGRQMDILAISVFLRYLQHVGATFSYPKNAYQAEYCRRIAEKIYAEKAEKYAVADDFFKDMNIADYDDYLQENIRLADELTACEARLNDADKKRIELIKVEQAEQKQQGEQYIDTLIARAKSHLGDDYAIFFDAALDSIRDDIEDDLREFGVEYQYWYSEKSLFSTGKIAAAIEVLREKGHLYEENGALWFKTTEFGDEKDRVVQRDNGAYTYFASDIAYHHDKLMRGYDQLVDIFGADHHGYMARVKAALQAFGHDADRLRFELVQFAVLYKGGEKMQMSTRSGKYVTLRDLRGMIGNSAARFFYVMRKPQQHMDFDLDLAVQTNKDNPLYYIQYAHARIASLLRKADAEGVTVDFDTVAVANLAGEHEQTLLRQIEKYADVVQTAARDYAPHQVIHYLKDLANALHSYYDAGNVKFLDDDELQSARFALLAATKQVLANGLQLSGVEAPETM